MSDETKKPYEIILGKAYKFYPGTIYRTNEGYDIKIIEYIDKYNVVIEFLYNGYRKTTQMVLVYGVRENMAYTVGVLVRGVTNVHCDIGPSVANPASSEVVWNDTSVTISHYLSSPLYVWDETGVKYHYVVIG